jgi:hypothetical protein
LNARDGFISLLQDNSQADEIHSKQQFQDKGRFKDEGPTRQKKSKFIISTRSEQVKAVLPQEQEQTTYSDPLLDKLTALIEAQEQHPQSEQVKVVPAREQKQMVFSDPVDKLVAQIETEAQKLIAEHGCETTTIAIRRMESVVPSFRTDLIFQKVFPIVYTRELSRRKFASNASKVMPARKHKQAMYNNPVDELVAQIEDQAQKLIVEYGCETTTTAIRRMESLVPSFQTDPIFQDVFPIVYMRELNRRKLASKVNSSDE